MFRVPRIVPLLLSGCVACLVALLGVLLLGIGPASRQPAPKKTPPKTYSPRIPMETSGIFAVYANVEPWRRHASMQEYASAFRQAVPRGLAAMDRHLASGDQPIETVLMTKAFLYNADGDPASAYKALEELEARSKGTPLEEEMLYTIIFYKGMTALRMGENDNCVHCRGESSCILPIAPSAVHTNPTG